MHEERSRGATRLFWLIPSRQDVTRRSLQDRLRPFSPGLEPSGVTTPRTSEPPCRRIALRPCLQSRDSRCNAGRQRSLRAVPLPVQPRLHDIGKRVQPWARREMFRACSEPIVIQRVENVSDPVRRSSGLVSIIVVASDEFRGSRRICSVVRAYVCRGSARVCSPRGLSPRWRRALQSG